MTFIPSIVTRNGARMLATRDGVVPLEDSGSRSAARCGHGLYRRPLTWPTILRDDPAHQPSLRICETCPQFSVRHNGCPTCRLIPGGCSARARYHQAILKREWPKGCPQTLTIGAT